MISLWKVNIKTKTAIFIFALLLASTYSIYNYYKNVSLHERLLRKGKYAKISSQYFPSTTIGYVKYYFITAKGAKIEHGSKCSEDQYGKFNHEIALYNPEDPSEHKLMHDFDNFSYGYQIFFFFILCLPLLTFFIYRITALIVALTTNERSI